MCIYIHKSVGRSVGQLVSRYVGRYEFTKLSPPTISRNEQ